MIHQEPTGAFRAGVLLAFGSAFGIVGLLLSAGGSAAKEVVFKDASPAVASLITWGPRSLTVLGGALALGAVLALSFGWRSKSDAGRSSGFSAGSTRRHETRRGS